MKKDKIKGIISTIGRGLKMHDYEANTSTPHIITWQTDQLPYDAMQLALNLAMVGAKQKYMIKDFNFYCKALGGDSIGWEVSLHIKELEPKP